MKSAAIIGYYRGLAYWYNGLIRAAACYRAEEKTGFRYTDEERRKMNEANRLLNQVESIVNEIYAKRIGEAIMQDIRYK